MTEKLFYADAHMRKFTARVLTCEERGALYAVTLDRTAFFPCLFIHISEPTRQAEISYAVFCLKKKKEKKKKKKKTKNTGNKDRLHSM